MTPEELVEKLKEFQGNEPESEHSKADRLLLEYIGDDKVTDAFNAIHKWYA